MNRIAICPGSYDPITVGHFDIVKRAARIFGSAEVVVMINENKEYLFSLDERYNLAKAAFAEEKNISVYKYDGMLYEYLSGREDAVIVKGIRNKEDFDYEKMMAEYNFEHIGIETLLLPASHDFESISSTYVRKQMSQNKDFLKLIPENTVKFFQNKL